MILLQTGLDWTEMDRGKDKLKLISTSWFQNTFWLQKSPVGSTTDSIRRPYKNRIILFAGMTLKNDEKCTKAKNPMVADNVHLHFIDVMHINLARWDSSHTFQWHFWAQIKWWLKEFSRHFEKIPISLQLRWNSADPECILPTKVKEISVTKSQQ